MSRKIIFLFLPFFYKYFRTEVTLKFFLFFHIFTLHILIIFITAEVEHALEGYNVSALNYLLKPVKEEALFKCLDISSEKIKENSSNAKYLVFSKGREQIKVDINNHLLLHYH